MLWLSLLLPALSLQLAERAFAGTELGNCIGPLVIVEGPPQRLQVDYCNDAARAAGIWSGIKLASAQALSHQLIAIERNVERERDALAELAAWAYQFSSQIVVQRDGLLLEIGGSERLFGRHAALLCTIADGLAELGYRGAFAQAATPRAARILALGKASGQRSTALIDLPLALLEWNADTTGTLKKLGLVTIGDVLALPRDAFGKRFGAARLDDLDRVRGCRPDPQPAYEPPQQFAARLELPADVADTAQLMWPARRLLASLAGFLRGRNAGVTELVFTTRHSQRRTQPLAPTEIRLALAAPERDATRLAALFKERLARVTLPAAVLTLALKVERLQPFGAINGSLLPQPAATGIDWLHLAETLHARLGSERVFQLQAVDDHRPECAWRAVPLAIEVDDVPPPLPAAPRPLLLLPTPQPLPMNDNTPIYREPLTLVAGPERIECGWWDHGRRASAVHRDYFIARNRRGQLLWVFRELAAPRGWFLHGIFA